MEWRGRVSISDNPYCPSCKKVVLPIEEMLQPISKQYCGQCIDTSSIPLEERLSVIQQTFCSNCNEQTSQIIFQPKLSPQSFCYCPKPPEEFPFDVKCYTTSVWVTDYQSQLNPLQYDKHKFKDMCDPSKEITPEHMMMIYTDYPPNGKTSL